MRTIALVMLMLASAARAGEPPKAVTTELYEDARVRAYEVRFEPGATARLLARPFRMVRALDDGMLERKAPGEAAVVEHWRAGEVRALPADVAATRNVGASVLRLYIVALKPVSSSSATP
ncbi:hypothetical protein [Lysobacter humi (ex Lee et al. 2017)]